MALFGDRMPLLDHVLKERQFAATEIHSGLYNWLSHYQQLMLLEAGIAGVVVPLLYAQGAALINPWFLRRSVLWFGVSLFTGVLISLVSKWFVVVLMARLTRHFTKQDEAIAAGEDEESIIVALAEVNAAFQPEARRLLLLTYSGILGDLVFYGGFLLGLFYLLQGFVQ